VTDTQPSADTKALLTPTKVLMQLAGFVVGLGLLAWIIHSAIREGDWQRFFDADPRLVAALLGCSLLSALLNGTMFWITIRPIKPLGYWDLQRINIVAYMLNYAPIRLGAIARVLYHMRVDGLGLLQVGAWFSLIGYTLALAMGSWLLATLVHPEVDWLWAGLVAVQLLMGGMAIRIFCGLPLIVRHGRGIDRMVSDHAALWGTIVLRVVDLGAFTGRMAVAATILGIDLRPSHVVKLAMVALAAQLIPFGRVGFREAAVAATGVHVVDVAGNMNQLALLESAGEALVFIPLGLLALFWFIPRWREGETTNAVNA
jgi:hypothetical protein